MATQRGGGHPQRVASTEPGAMTQATTQAATQPRQRRQPYVTYPYVCAGYGSIRFAGAIHDKDLLAKLSKTLEGTVDGGPQERFVPKADHVDRSVYGIMPMELFRQTERDVRFKRRRAWPWPTHNGMTRTRAQSIGPDALLGG